MTNVPQMTASRPGSHQCRLSLAYEGVYPRILQSSPLLCVLSTTPIPSFTASAWTSAQSVHQSPGLQALSSPAFLCQIWTFPPSCGIQRASACGPPLPTDFSPLLQIILGIILQTAQELPHLRAFAHLVPLPRRPFPASLPRELLLIFQGPLPLGSFL